MKSELFEKLSAKYSGALPRYTSYPTAVELKHELDAPRITAEYSSVFNTRKPLSLYIHLPFCPSLCYFCACNKIITQDQSQIDHYLGLLEKEATILHTLSGSRLLLEEVHLESRQINYV